MDIEQNKSNKIIFPIVTIFITGITVGMLTFSIVPLFIQNYSIIAPGLKTIIYMIFFLYFLENIFVLSGSYLMIKHNKINYFLLITALLYSITISVNGLKFAFLPFRLDFTLQYNSGNSIVGVGVNLIGLIFIIWWCIIYKKDNFISKLNMEDLCINPAIK